MASEPQKWHVALTSVPGGTLGSRGGLFDSEEAAQPFVETLPPDEQARALVMRWNRPEGDASQ